MTGMGGGHHDRAVIEAFHRVLLHQGFVAAGLAVLVFIAWNWGRSAQLRNATTRRTPGPAGGPLRTEAPARRFIRITFGLLWILDGVLQAQPAMPTSLVPDVIRPAAATSPGWVRDLVATASDVWTRHPAHAAAAAVWIQVGLGLWLLVAPPGRWSTAGGLASAAWAGVVWVFGEAFGGLFGSGQSFLTGTPGPALLYLVAGLLVAMPERIWETERTGRLMLRTAGALLVGMAVLQAWPGRGSWRGGGGGALVSMVRQMSRTGQPALTASAVRSFVSFDAAHGWAVNLFAVVILLGTGAAFLSGRRELARPALAVSLVLAAADWLLVQDLGFLGGVGTDPNSMIPWALLLLGGYLALSRVPERSPARARPAATPVRDHMEADPTWAVRVVAAAAAVGLTALGALPMAYAALT